MDSEKTETPAVWAIVELMGHVKLAGRLSEEEKFGVKMGRLDIPTGDKCSAVSDNWCPVCGRCTCPQPEESKDDPKCPLHKPTSIHGERPEFVSQFFGGGSVYRITIVTEDVARHVAKGNKPQPVSPWDFPKQLAAATPDPGSIHEQPERAPYSDREDDSDWAGA